MEKIENNTDKEFNILKTWIENKDFVGFLAKKGLEIGFTRLYSFNRRPKDSQILGDYRVLENYHKMYLQRKV